MHYIINAGKVIVVIVGLYSIFGGSYKFLQWCFKKPIRRQEGKISYDENNIAYCSACDKQLIVEESNAGYIKSIQKKCPTHGILESKAIQ